MTKADSVHSTPRILASQFPPTPLRPRQITIFDIAVHQLQAVLDLHRLRREAEQEVERLLAFLDMTDGFTFSELEEQCDDEGARPDDEEHEPSGIADAEGLLEQLSGIPGYHLPSTSVGYARGVE